MSNQNNNIELFSTYPDVVSVEQLMDMVHIGKVLAYKLLKTNKIKSLKIGREYKIAKVHVTEFVIGQSSSKEGLK